MRVPVSRRSRGTQKRKRSRFSTPFLEEAIEVDMPNDDDSDMCLPCDVIRHGSPTLIR